MEEDPAIFEKAMADVQVAVRAAEALIAESGCSRPVSMNVEVRVPAGGEPPGRDGLETVRVNAELFPYCDVQLRWNGRRVRVAWRMAPGSARRAHMVRSSDLADLMGDHALLGMVCAAHLDEFVSLCRLVSP